MGQPCSTNKKKKPATLDEITNLPTSPIASKPDLIVIKKIPRYNIPKQLSIATNIDTKSVTTWKKNHQRSQRQKYTERPQKNEETFQSRFMRITKNPSSFKFLKEICLNFKSQEEGANLNLLGDVLREHKALEKLKLSFRRWPNINNEAFIHLFSGLKKLMHIKYLGIDLKGCLSPAKIDGVIEELARCIKRNLELEVVKLNISHNSSFSDEELITLGKSLERLRKLKTVTIIGNRLSRISKEGLKIFAKSLIKIKTLTELELYFNGGWMISSSGFRELSQGIGKIHSLEKLVLSFDELIQDKVLESLSSCLRDLKKLTVLKVCVGRCVRHLKKGRSLENLLERLNKLPALKNIYIDLRKSNNQWVKDEYERFKSHRFYLASDLQVTREEIEVLARYLKENQVIRSVALDYEKCQAINDAGLELLAKGLEMNMTINDIAFDFSRCGEITDKGLTQFSESLNAVALRSIKLNFNEAFRITNEGMMGFYQSFRGFLLLKCLHLDFSWCWQINTKGLESIIKALEGLFPLRDLSLNFSNCGGFSDESLDKLGGCLENLYLEKIHLAFKKNDAVTGQGFIRLVDRIKKMEKVAVAALNFYWCSKITTKELDYLIEQFQTCETLKQVSLCFEMCGDISRERLREIKSESFRFKLEMINQW